MRTIDIEDMNDVELEAYKTKLTAYAIHCLNVNCPEWYSLYTEAFTEYEERDWGATYNIHCLSDLNERYEQFYITAYV